MKTLASFLIKTVMFIITAVYGAAALWAWAIHYDSKVAYWGTRAPLNEEEILFIHGVLYALPVIVLMLLGLYWLNERISKKDA